MTLTNALHLLRNPWGHPDEAIREARLWAADKLEYLTRAHPLCPTCACLPGHHPADDAGTLHPCPDPWHAQGHSDG